MGNRYRISPYHPARSGQNIFSSLPGRFWAKSGGMAASRFLSITEQVTGALRADLWRGRWRGLMPGKHHLAKELEVNNKTVEAALRQLEAEGLLVAQGAGRQRLIRLPERLPEGQAPPSLRVGILLFEPADRKLDYIVELQHALVEAGHGAIYASHAMMELGMEVPRIARMVQKTAADAWVVIGGARAVLEWFSVQPVPAFDLFGRRLEVPIASAGPDKPPAMAAATRELLGLGHRRIVLLARRLRRLPEPGKSERVFLEELKVHGVAVGAYNLPDWEETREGLQELLGALFQVTPPTALIIQEATFFAATQQFLARRRLLVPEQVSLVCTDADPTFAWCTPSISHIRWDSGPVVRSIVRWAATVSRGGKDIRQTLTRAEFIPGGTIGPAAAGSGE